MPTIQSYSSFTPLAENSPAPGTLTLPHTIVSGTNRCLFVGISGVFSSAVSAAFNGLPMMPLKYAWKEFSTMTFYLLNPPVGAYNVVFTWTQTLGNYGCAAIGTCYDDVSQTVPYRLVPIGDGQTGVNPSLSVPTISGNKVLCFGNVGDTTKGGSQTLITSITSNDTYSTVKLQATESEVESNTWSPTASNWTLVGVSINPASVTGNKPIPAIEHFESYMDYLGNLQADGIIAGHTDWVANGDPNRTAVSDVWIENGVPFSQYYSGPKVMYDIGEYRGETVPWNEAGEKGLIVYDEAYMQLQSSEAGIRSIPGYRIFTDNARKDYEKLAKSIDLQIAEDLRDNAAYGLDSNDMSHVVLCRENSYHIRAHIDCASLPGIAPRTTRYNQLVAWAKGHVNYWLNDDWIGIDIELQPFYMGLTGRALIMHQEVTGDTEVLPLLKDLCDYMEQYWDILGYGWWYQANPDYSGGFGNYAAPSLNNLIGPMHAWVAKNTGIQSYMDRADWSFVGSAMVAGTGYTTGKQFNQAHTWVFDQLDWRNEFYTATPTRRSGRLFRRGA